MKFLEKYSIFLLFLFFLNIAFAQEFSMESSSDIVKDESLLEFDSTIAVTDEIGFRVPKTLVIKNKDEYFLKNSLETQANFDKTINDDRRYRQEIIDAQLEIPKGGIPAYEMTFEPSFDVEASNQKILNTTIAIQEKIEDADFKEKARASLFNSLNSFMRLFEKDRFQLKYDPNFRYDKFMNAQTDISFANMDEKSINRIMTSKSVEEANYEVEQYKLRRTANEILATGSKLTTFVANLFAMLFNPLSILLFLIIYSLLKLWVERYRLRKSSNRTLANGSFESSLKVPQQTNETATIFIIYFFNLLFTPLFLLVGLIAGLFSLIFYWLVSLILLIALSLTKLWNKK